MGWLPPCNGQQGLRGRCPRWRDSYGPSHHPQRHRFAESAQQEEAACGEAARITMRRTLTRTHLQEALGQPARLERGSFHDGSMRCNRLPTIQLARCGTRGVGLTLILKGVKSPRSPRIHRSRSHRGLTKFGRPNIGGLARIGVDAEVEDRLGRSAAIDRSVTSGPRRVPRPNRRSRRNTRSCFRVPASLSACC